MVDAEHRPPSGLPLWRLTFAAILCACAGSTADIPAPSPAPISYELAAVAIARRVASDSGIIVAGEGTIFLTHGKTTPRAFLLLHGFTDSPTQFRIVAEHLFASGANVYAPRLPHHAERHSPVRALGRVRAGELASFGDSVAEVTRGLGDTVIVIGLSAGATIAAWIAQTRVGVPRVVLIAPALAAGRLSDKESDDIVRVATRLPDIRRSDAPDSTRPGYQQGVSTRGLAELLSLGTRVRDAARDRAPRAREAAFLLNERDETVSEKAALDLAEHWFERGAVVRVYRFPRSLGLRHNVLEAEPGRGGRADVVYPVVEALALSAPVPDTAPLVRDVPCRGFKCAFLHWADHH